VLLIGKTTYLFRHHLTSTLDDPGASFPIAVCVILSATSCSITITGILFYDLWFWFFFHHRNFLDDRFFFFYDRFGIALKLLNVIL